MTKLFIANIQTATGPKPLVTVRAAAEGEARLFLEAAYPDDEIVAVTEPNGWASDATRGARPEMCANIRAWRGRRPRAMRADDRSVGDP